VYYRRKQNEDPPPLVDPKIWLSLALTGLVLIAMGLILKAADAADIRDITAKIADLDSRRNGLFQELPIAENENQVNAPKFARRHSEGFDTRLKNARTYLQKGGDVQVLQTKAQQELDSGNREQARVTWQSADGKLVFSKEIIDTLIHPPFYAELQRKTDAVKGNHLQESQKAINLQGNYVANLPIKYLCGTGSTLSYASANAIVVQAQSSLDAARTTAQLVLPEGVIDYPLAYDQAESAVNKAKTASSTANALSAQADTAANEITSANTSLIQAAGKLFNAYDAVSAKSYYDQAVAARDNAVDACGKQDFWSVTNYVSSSKSFSNLSIDAATPPTPTPVPSNTPEPSTAVPFVLSDDDDNPSPSVDLSSDDTNDSYDFSSDEQDPSDGFGGSDAQDPSDGFGGTDSQDNQDGFGD